MAKPNKGHKNIRPPKKGEVRNPKGKPAGTLNRSTIAKKWLESLVTAKNPLTGKQSKLPAQDQMTLSMIRKAMDGDVSAYRELMDSAFGKAMQSTDVTSGGKPLKETTKIIFENFNGDSDK